MTNALDVHRIPAPCAAVRKNMLQTTMGVKTKITVLPHPPYSPDFVPCNFRIFPELACHLQGRRFQSADKLKVLRRLN
ncbi:hypothetical protein TNCV_2078511 [Trichonephila clavipes]|nr:hypothetical protein TNCV_2078511 [Trichonephila clavipes]